MTTNEKNTVFVSFLLDETGSMESIKNDTIGGFNTYIKELQQSDDEILFSLVSFNSSKTKRRYVAEPVAKVKPLTKRSYRPTAMTPLIDAAVKIIKATDEAVEQRNHTDDVIIVMQTDGMENVSVEYTAADLALLVKEKEAAGWQFVFLGAGMDAFQAARTAGIRLAPDRVMSYGLGRSSQMFDILARKTTRYARSGALRDLDFDEADREEAGDVFHTEDKPTEQTKKRSSSVDDFSL